MKKRKRGGRRPGSGRPPLDPAGAGRKHSVYLPPTESELLAALGKGSVSAGVRELVKRHQQSVSAQPT